ncbi:MAG: hypothetical protein JNJ40_16895 [Bacteroidia bacterium]|nr:hypothetical protein [Bacteroidia bacterium]
MKNSALLFITLVLLSSCTPTTQITGSWKNPKQTSTDIQSVFIAALTGNIVVKSTLENNISEALNKENIASIKSVDEFPPGLLKDSIPKEVIMDKIKKKNHQAILTISLLKKKTESRYIRGSTAYAPMSRFGYYDNFYGYYSYWSPYAYSPGYYVNDDVYYLETNLYNSKTEALIWSAQSKTYSYDGLSSFSKTFAKVIVKKMKEDGIVISK